MEGTPRPGNAPRHSDAFTESVGRLDLPSLGLATSATAGLPRLVRRSTPTLARARSPTTWARQSRPVAPALDRALTDPEHRPLLVRPRGRLRPRGRATYLPVDRVRIVDACDSRHRPHRHSAEPSPTAARGPQILDRCGCRGGSAADTRSTSLPSAPSATSRRSTSHIDAHPSISWTFVTGVREGHAIPMRRASEQNAMSRVSPPSSAFRNVCLQPAVRGHTDGHAAPQRLRLADSLGWRQCASLVTARLLDAHPGRVPLLRVTCRHLTVRRRNPSVLGRAPARDPWAAVFLYMWEVDRDPYRAVARRRHRPSARPRRGRACL